MADYPINFRMSDQAAFESYPPEVRAEITEWLMMAAKKVHEERCKTDPDYRIAHEYWLKIKKG